MVDREEPSELNDDSLNSSTVIVGHGASAQHGLQLARFISQRRYRVESFEASAEDADEKIRQWVVDSESKPKMFFLVVSQDDIDEGDQAWVRRGVLTQAQKLLSAFGKGRVILVVESGILDFDYKSGLDDVLFSSGKLAETYKSVAAFLLREFPSEGTAGPGRGRALDRMRKSREPLEADVKVAILLLSVAALLGTVYIFRSFSGHATAQVVPDISGVQLTAPDADPASRLPPASPSTRVASPTISEPATGLPASCRISLARGVVVPRTVYCETGGGLRVSGYSGPWHNSIARIGLESEVTGTVTYESDGETVPLKPGVTDLNPAEAAFGVQSLALEFRADGKRVQFEGFAENGTRVMSLTFDSTLRRP